MVRAQSSFSLALYLIFHQNLEFGREDGTAQQLFEYFRLLNASIKLDEHMMKKQKRGK